MKNKIILILLLAVILLCFIGIGYVAGAALERDECLHWKEYAVEHPTIGFDQWQIDQCTHYEITI